MLRIVACSLLALSLFAAEPRYDEKNRLLRPENYREWVFVGSSIGMGYSDEAPNPERATQFHNIYMEPGAYRSYTATGKFPDKTMLVMEILTSASKESINKQGRFEDQFIGIEVALKDESRFPEKWAYFNFIGANNAPLKEATPFRKEACWSCHNKNAASDNVFLQFYPVLRAARQGATR